MTQSMEIQKKPLDIVIVGGSLAGLMCGIVLRDAGHTIRILEQGDNERQSHMAGVCLGPSAGVFLAQHDRHSRPFFKRTLRLLVLATSGAIRFFVKGRRDMTSWDAYYFRLRSNFDAYISSYYPRPPLSSERDGSVSYETHTKVVDLASDGDDRSKMRLSVLNLESQDTSELQADLIIGADGPDSFVRNKYLPHVQREYAGYIAWRGTVPESHVSDATRKLIEQGPTVHLMHRNHCVIYSIPGPNGTLESGERFFNFLWYTNQSQQDLDEILVDSIDGHRHHNTVPAGRVQQKSWNRQLELAQAAPFPSPFLEIIMKIERPFIQVVTHLCSPQATFEGGKVLLIGDALSLYCPHTALSGTQAAFHSMATEKYVSGEITLQEYERKVLRYSHLYWSQSIWWGRFYQRHILVAFWSGLYYWASFGINRIRSWSAGMRQRAGTAPEIADEYAT
ncbi:uncharacterized protein F4822DRAFT_420943 [Hypoxylon trugodes]|uniref:uncharacterized protein n=1 Tax=Hypoxylon trugodes TaxID=326681 RepID=UPI002198DF05|nr:uncharacterized protein F4822DRAFT_420943 [Hypoxylon trugodes]KAI1383548.1 hypothetical protein F4822DRAFT_420943 [Hypoxylon trugodes]